MKKKESQKQKPEIRVVTQFGMINFPAGDFLIRIKNAALARKHEVVTVYSKLSFAIAETLKKENLLDEIKKEDGKILVWLTYKKKEPAIIDLRLISKPGIRVYKGVNELEKIKGPSIFIVSTSKGVMSSKEAVKKRLGGEVLAEVL